MSAIATYFDRSNQRIICKDVDNLEDAVRKAPLNADRILLDVKLAVAKARMEIRNGQNRFNRD